MDKKYLLLGDYVISKNDANKHFISAENLCRFYQLNPDECIFSIAGNEGKNSRRGIPEDLMILRPRLDGDYLEHIKSRTHQSKVTQLQNERRK